MDLIRIQNNHTFIEELERKLNTDSTYSTFELFKLAYQAEQARITPSFSGLRSLDFLPHMNFLPHQISTAKIAIEKMNGRAILADEVGLGKTIEAGLILKEYMLRGLVKNALILVPASLVSQWVQELNTKFYIPTVANKKNHNWKQEAIIVSSLDTVKRSPHREEILKNEYDFVLIDEAHKLKNHQTKNYEFVRNLSKKYCLLLTATPIQNNLIEIFNLISILKPGLLGDINMFKKKFGNQSKHVENNSYLKQLIDHVMIRNIRENIDFHPSKRVIETIWVTFSEKEAEAYEKIQSINEASHAFTKVMLLRELCSSREACYLSLDKIRKSTDNQHMANDMDQMIKDIQELPQHAKAKSTVELIQSLGDKKVIIFTEYRATQLYLQWYLQQNGIQSVPFRGGFSRSKKDWMIQLFKGQAQVLIATEAGAEGINLQFCNHLINYDLPWNPMKLEQRIGRIHRFGQQQDVNIYNIAVKNTIEEHVLTTLYDKIQLFENVIGKLDAILSTLNLKDMEEEIQTIYSESETAAEAKIKLNNLASIIQQAGEINKNVGETHEQY
ncbi:DEAD/DEAH box helicase [Oceanobacillus sp. CAU 1775]